MREPDTAHNGAAGETERSPVQISANVPWALAMGARRAAKLLGVPLNTYVADLIAADLAERNELLRREFADEEQELISERDAMLAAINRTSK